MTALLEQEIREQGSALRARAKRGMGAARRAAALLGRRDVEHVVIAARGSSDNAARFAQYMLGDELGIQVGLAAPWLFRKPQRTPRLTNAAVIGISQSGRSPDIVSVLAAATAQHRPTIAITADPRSPLAQTADVVIQLLTSEERSVAATKTYLASLHAVVQVVETIAPAQARRDWLEQLPDLAYEMSERMLAGRERFDPLAGTSLVTVTGRGLLFAAACESALKLRELSGIPAEAFSPPDLIHGPIAALHRSGGAWLIDPSDELDDVLDRAGPSVIVSADQTALASASIPIRLPADVPDWAASFLAVIPGQAAALRLAERAGVDVDHPHGLQKVTLTR